MRKNAAHNAEYRGGYANSCTAQWGKLGGHIDNVILSNLLSNTFCYEHLLVFINQ